MARRELSHFTMRNCKSLNFAEDFPIGRGARVGTLALRLRLQVFYLARPSFGGKPERVSFISPINPVPRFSASGRASWTVM